MKLLFIYGSPAVGKLTVANEIAKRTNFKVFHNHLTIDAVKPIFEFGTKPFWKLVHLFRIETLKEAAKENVNLIFTFCYAKDDDDEFIANVKNIIENNGGEVCLILLTAEKSEIEKRVTEESRLKYNKANSVTGLNKMWEQHDLFSPVNNFESLEIDNTNTSAKKTADKIIKHFQIDLMEYE
jgi:shikimate kinase